MPKIINPIDPDRLCLFCEYFAFDLGEDAYSEVTPGHSANFFCYKNRQKGLSNYAGRAEFIKYIQTARTCPDFKRDDSIEDEV